MAKVPENAYTIENDERYIVRSRIKNGKLEIFVHRRCADGDEWVPGAYLIGYNTLSFDIERVET